MSPTATVAPTGAQRLKASDPRLESLFLRCSRDCDRAARDELTQRFLPLARKLARRYSYSSEPYEDLVQIASLALVKAIDRFDSERGTSFEAFAIPTILGELRRYFRDSGWALHVPRRAQERALAVEEANRELLNVHGRSPTVSEIAQYLELSEEDVLDGLQAAQAYATTPLDAPRSANDDGEAGVIEVGAIDERYELIDADIAVTEALRSLPQRERLILHLRFVSEMTQSEIAARLGISQMQVSRLLRRTLAQMRELAGAEA